MKKKFIMASLVFVGIVASVTVSQKAKAVPEGLTIHVCTITDDNGVVLSIGNTCDTGNSNCVANPCNKN